MRRMELLSVHGFLKAGCDTSDIGEAKLILSPQLAQISGPFLGVTSLA